MRRDFQKFSIALDAGDGTFAGFPTEFQKDWLLGRALREFADDLEHLADIGRRFVPGVERPAIDDAWEKSSAGYDEAELVIQGQQVMQAWERPLMRRLAQGAARSHGDVLEVGFGMGISATFLQEEGVRSYTIAECNDEVISFFGKWRAQYPDQDIRLLRGRWQEVVDQMGEYDGILFDTYPLSQEEYLQNEVAGTAYTHAGEFFPVAAAHLRPGGVFTYFSCEIDTLSRGHQRELLRHFDSFSVSVVRGLQPPADCQYWWADSMAVVEATKAG